MREALNDRRRGLVAPSARGLLCAALVVGLGGGLAPELAGAAEPAPVRVIPRAELERALLAAAAVGGAAARLKLARLPDEVVLYDGSDPLFRSEPARALSCGSPCRSGTLALVHPYFELFVDCADGSFSATTGSAHPLTLSSGSKQNVLYDGLVPLTGSEVALHEYTGGTDAMSPTGGDTCSFDPADTATEPASMGLERETSLTPAAGLDLLLREELVAFGSSPETAGLRFTLSLVNKTSSTRSAELGMRLFLDLKNAGEDGPRRAAVRCSPFSVGMEEFTEHELAAGEILDYLRVRNVAAAPELAYFMSTSARSDFPTTARPDRLVYGWYGNMFGAPWDYAAFELDSAASDSVLLYYFGGTSSAALRLAPGETATRSLVLLGGCDGGSACTRPSGGIGNDLRAAKALPASVALSWPAATSTPPEARLFRTEIPAELAETAAGIGDELVVATTTTRAASDAGALPAAVGELLLYAVLPVDACGGTVYP